MCSATEEKNSEDDLNETEGKHMEAHCKGCHKLKINRLTKFVKLQYRRRYDMNNKKLKQFNNTTTSNS